ncbi:hypothetical protein HID58_054892 [Brassica napus]|uniref:(rape) hypothetical protein n=1 Tax=Brassica napus TaxID=3708 RepID=A0A816IGL2_BRANA|nr:mediator-associated protein 2-like [Brassica napus]KAH0892463.1 hypothetical protein HID58_054892 [Brassica napus]CAF1707108.1 unnamed protein product [Brassica napus]
MTLDYKPSEEFQVSKLQSLLDFDVTGAKELWLIQCPISHFPEIEAKELKVKLDEDGVLGGFEDSYRKEVDLVSFASQDADATVIIPSEKESKIVGKISRRVSLVRFLEPEELLETMKVKTQQKLAGAAVTSSSVRNSNPAQSSRRKSGQSSLRHSTSSRQKSVFPSSSTKTPMSSKRKHSEPSSSKHHGSATTLPGSSDRSDKSKKKVKTEN